MSRTKIVMSVAFILTLGAGVVVGLLGARLPQDREPRSWLADELHLTPAQREQMQTIWSELSRRGRSEANDPRRAAEKKRNDALLALLSDEQKAKYEALNKEFADQMQEFNRQREEAFKTAVERTKQILTPEQREKYETLIQKRRGDGREGFRHGGPGGLGRGGPGPGGPGLGPGGPGGPDGPGPESGPGPGPHNGPPPFAPPPFDRPMPPPMPAPSTHP